MKFPRIFTTNEKRPCIVNYEDIGETKAIFHTWSNVSRIQVPFATLIGAIPGGTVACPVGIVEHEDGSVHYPRADQIRFLDSAKLFNEYCFEE